jgi:hypothetical protein
MTKRVAVWTLEEKLAVAESLPELGNSLRADTRIARADFSLEHQRHQAALAEIAARFDAEVWTIIAHRWSKNEINKARKLEQAAA